MEGLKSFHGMSVNRQTELTPHQQFKIAYWAYKSEKINLILSKLNKLGRSSVTKVWINCRMNQGEASKILNLLECIGVVTSEKIGKHNYFTATGKTPLEALKEYTNQLN